jgi:hypothetical protein
MARIPTPRLAGQEVGSVQIQGTPTPFQNLQTNADMFGAAQAQALQQASKGLDAAADGLLQRAKDDDATSLLEVQNNAAEFETDLLNNTETGILTKQGRNAQGASKEAMDRFNDWQRTLPVPTTNSGRLAQQEYLTRLKAAVFKSAAAHERVEITKYKAGEVEKALGNNLERAARFYNDPGIVRDTASAVQAQAEHLADLNGLGEEGRQQLVQTSLSSMYRKAIAAAVDQDDYAKANELLEAHRDEMTIEDREAANTAVQKSTLRGSSQREFDRIRASGLNPQAQVEEARKIEDPDIRAATVDLITAENTRVETYRKRDISDRFDRAVLAARNGEKVPDSLTAGFDDDQLQHIEKIGREAELLRADPDYRRTGDGGATWAKWMQYRTDVDWATKTEFTELQAKFETGVTEDQWKAIMAEWGDKRLAANTLTAKNEADLAKKGLEGPVAETPISALDTGFQALGLKQKDNPTEWAAWVAEYNRRRAALQPTTPQARQNIIDQMVASKITSEKTILGAVIDTREDNPFLTDFDTVARRMADDMGLSSTAEDQLVAAFPSVLSSMSIKYPTTPVTNDLIMQEVIFYNSIATQLTARDVARFTVEYPVYIQTLINQRADITADNILKLFRD